MRVLDTEEVARRHNRVGRAVKIVGPWRVGVSLVFGVVATVLVAWWIALEPGKLPDFPGERRDPIGSHWRGGPVAGGMPPLRFSAGGGDAFEFTTLNDHGTWCYAQSFEADEEHYKRWSQGAHKEQRSQRPTWIGGLGLRDRVYQGDPKWFKEYAYGWPFLAMKHQHLVPADTRIYFSSLELPSWRRQLIGVGRRQAPMGFITVGFVLDSVFWSVPIYMLLSVAFSLVYGCGRVIRYRRSQLGCCARCGYLMTGLVDDMCPECGWVINRKK